jgi:hypothetical protein
MSYHNYYPNHDYFDARKDKEYWFEVWLDKKPIDLTKFELVVCYHTGIEAFGSKEIGGEPGPTLLDIEAMQRYIQKQFPEGWKITSDGNVVSAKL